MNHQGPQIPEDVNDSNLYRAYRLLLSVCETGVLSRACDRTGLSLPTASRLLARARTWFDDPLFVHSAGRMYPTVRMKALRPRLIEAMRATDALFNEENVFDPQSAEGVVRIVAIDNAFYTLLIPLIIGQQAMNVHDRLCCEMPFIVAGASLVARTDLVMRTPRETAVLLAKGLPLDVLHSEEDVSLPWRPGLFWHECSTNSPLLTWVRARLAVKAREIYDAAEKVLPF